MNKTNLYKQIGVFTLMIATIFALVYIDAEFYKALMFIAGSWALGATVGKFARARWPLHDKVSK